jgi:hypothetical protein
MEPMRKKEYTEALPHYAKFIEGNQKDFRDRIAKADQRNMQIYNDTYKS